MDQMLHLAPGVPPPVQKLLRILLQKSAAICSLQGHHHCGRKPNYIIAVHFTSATVENDPQNCVPRTLLILKFFCKGEYFRKRRIGVISENSVFTNPLVLTATTLVLTANMGLTAHRVDFPIGIDYPHKIIFPWI